MAARRCGGCARRVAVGWLETATGTVTAEKLILATNGYTDGLWPGLRRSLVPLFSAIAATEPLPEAVVQAIMPSRSSLYEIGSITVYYRFDPDNRLLMGGRSVQRDVTIARHVAVPDANTRCGCGRCCGTFVGRHGWSGRTGLHAGPLPAYP